MPTTHFARKKKSIYLSSLNLHYYCYVIFKKIRFSLSLEFWTIKHCIVMLYLPFQVFITSEFWNDQWIEISFWFCAWMWKFYNDVLFLESDFLGNKFVSKVLHYYIYTNVLCLSARQRLFELNLENIKKIKLI